jgi:hypothetical protein
MSINTYFLDTFAAYVEAIDACGVHHLNAERFGSSVQDLKIPAVGKLPVSLPAG